MGLFSRECKAKHFSVLFCFLIQEVCLKSELKKDSSPQVFLSNQAIVILLFPFVFFSPCSPFYLNIGFNKEKDALKICCRKKYTKQDHFLKYNHHNKEKGSSGPVASQDITCPITVPHTPLRMGQEKVDLSSRYNVLIVLSCLSHMAGLVHLHRSSVVSGGRMDREHSSAQVRQKQCS